MSCTRRKESRVAIVIGARGFELKAGRMSITFPSGPPRVVAAPDLKPGELVFERRHPGLASGYGSGRLLLEPAESILRCNGPVPSAESVIPEGGFLARLYS